MRAEKLTSIFTRRFLGHLLVAPSVVLIIHLVAGWLGMYDLFPDFDVPMHFLGGLSIACSIELLLREFAKKKFLVISHSALRYAAIVCGVFAVAVVWEWQEFVFDLLFGARMQLGLADTMGDLFFGFLGGLAGAFFYSPDLL